jgi:hypothetical protein
MSSLFTDGRAKRTCTYCGGLYRPRVPEQVVCGPACRAARKSLEARSARRTWDAHGRPIINDNTDLRYRSAR